MQIVTDDPNVSIAADHPMKEHFTVLRFSDGTHSLICKNFFQDWLGRAVTAPVFHIGRGSGIGVGSIVKYDTSAQTLRIGNYVSGGSRVRFVLNGQHETRSISTSMFSFYNPALRNPNTPQYPDMVIQHDVWIGDEAMFLGGCMVETGCIIGARALVPPRFRCEAYGIYVGAPARLVKFRFSEKVREALLDLAWWTAPAGWIQQNNQAFLADFTKDEVRSLEIIAELKRRLAAFRAA